MDIVSNVLSTIKNCAMSGRKSVEVSHSKAAEDVLKILKSFGFLTEVRVFKPEGSAFKKLHVELAFDGKTPKISEIKRVSKPGRRIYRKSSEVRNALGSYGVTVVSTSRGIMAANEARKKKLGGEVVCEVF